ncbi:hypothetical protein FGO68_gene14300 [Halteria grandinella]|uniref:Uncharacterized protein n=1 Tax=Halteria grandinella TaxID=5974 RepID=A0A8J8P067_HALGN|nr:hypothetical protein FGO68_gene14300 [Halteria grandinella]
MKSTLLILSAALALVSAAPDCYDYSVTTPSADYFDMLPKMLFYGNVDWMTIQGGKNCGFYTYGDVFLRTYDASTNGIYFVFTKTLGTDCTLNLTMQNFKNETWLYANSVGFANSGSVEQMVQIIRTGAVYVAGATVAGIVALGAMLFY